MSNTGDSTKMDPDEGRDDLKEIEKKLTNLTTTVSPEQPTQSQGEPMRVGVFNLVGSPAGGSGVGTGSSRSTPEKSSNIKGILKNRDMRSPVAPNALNYEGPVDTENIRDNNYEDEQRFSPRVDSRELYARKVRAGLVKRRVRNTSTESAPELTFYPKRQYNDDSDEDDGGKAGGGGGGADRPRI